MYLGLGSNLGDRRARLLDALERLSRYCPVLRVSSFYRTDPVGFADQPDFYNAAAAIAWPGTPEDLLDALRSIEIDMGRVPRFQNGPREIDLDLLDFDGLVRSHPDPVLPHPRITTRRFVLTPLSEIAPAWRHPVWKKTAAELLWDLPEKPGVSRIDDDGNDG
ncbi:MAG: 2-amino-4-hydroxy-6-hydroxymethyldihydropteridine diphosphokinase [Acidobacteria bacterium]|nr:2-amino-4-hydroxy-6-hydroxymethyldihydropteridine diphosphokinase [Acidobacteriota bacterium]MCA1611088.1 2-amino-4-hydroxy-6-hydroxymethyldihydropteridine diphosphokinase [Acidobacteriota bacterium]